jgi:uncharacterized protein with NRDE domain
MCLILFALDTHPRYRLILATNRDEFFARRTQSLHWWPHQPDLLAGRDLEAGGTWFGIRRNGRFAAITNYRQPTTATWNTSRGQLTLDFLLGDDSPEHHLQKLHTVSDRYAGFNLLLGDGDELWHYSNRDKTSNRAGEPTRIPPGIHGLSNALLDTPWPKVAGGRDTLAQALIPEPAPQALFALLAETTTPADAALPDTGVGIEMERLLGSRFIRGDNYGTRASTLLMIGHDGTVDVHHRDFDPGQTLPTTESHWNFPIK